MNNKEMVVTAEGLKALEDELEELKTVKRKEVAEKIKVARGFGDLSENSEYDEAKNEQGLVESLSLIHICSGGAPGRLSSASSAAPRPPGSARRTGTAAPPAPTGCPGP